MPQLLKLLVFVFASVLLSGCKIAAIVVEGGRLYPPYSRCEAGNICIYEVTDTNFEQQFVAWPDRGWIFDRWQAGDSFLCGDRRQRSCTVSLSSLEEETAEKIISSSETSFLMPIFRRARDVIEVDGKEWYQPYLFVDLSWNEINAICPDGICNGTLNGYDLTGWFWASVKDMNDLFNYYIGSDLLGPGPDYTSIPNAQSSLAFDGWHPTFQDNSVGYLWAIVGLTKDALNTDPNLVWCADWFSAGFQPAFAVTNCKANKDTNAHPYIDGIGVNLPPSRVGVWFYRVS